MNTDSTQNIFTEGFEIVDNALFAWLPKACFLDMLVQVMCLASFPVCRRSCRDLCFLRAESWTKIVCEVRAESWTKIVCEVRAVSKCVFHQPCQNDSWNVPL